MSTSLFSNSIYCIWTRNESIWIREQQWSKIENSRANTSASFNNSIISVLSTFIDRQRQWPTDRKTGKQYTLEHWRSSFPTAGLSHTRHSVRPVQDPVANWCPFSAFSLPSFSFAFPLESQTQWLSVKGTGSGIFLLTFYPDRPHETAVMIMKALRRGRAKVNLLFAFHEG